MKKLYLSILGLLVLVMPLTVMGCETTAPATTTPLFVTTEAFNAKVNELTTLINTKANQGALNTQVERIDKFTGQVDTYTKAELYTQAQVNAQIAAAVAALKADQAWVTGTTTTSAAGTTVGEYGELVDTDGDLELWLERVSGAASDELRTRDGINEARFDFIVVNKDTASSHDFKIYLEFEPDIDVILDMAVTETYATASGGLMYTAVRSPNSGRGILRIDPTNDGRILKGDVEDYTVWLTVKQTTIGSIDWEMSFRVDDRD